jgi:hypothetical protein
MIDLACCLGFLIFMFALSGLADRVHRGYADRSGQGLPIPGWLKFLEKTRSYMASEPFQER